MEFIKKNLIHVYLILIVVWVCLLVGRYYAHLHVEDPSIGLSAIDGLVGVPMAGLVMVYLVGFMGRREQRARKRRLMLLKSCMFRLELRDLYAENLLSLKSPPLTFGAMKNASLEELKAMREAADEVEYTSVEAMEKVVAEYLKAQRTWRDLMNVALERGFEDVFQDMLGVVHFITDVQTFGELNPRKSYVHETANDSAMAERMLSVLGDGVRKYLDYIIELKQKQPDLFDQVVGDYQLLAERRSGGA